MNKQFSDEFPGWEMVEDEQSCHAWLIGESHVHVAHKQCLCDPVNEFTDIESGKELWVHLPNLACQKR